MLPKQHKLRASSDFSIAVRKGRRIGRKTIVLHVFDTAAFSSKSGPRTDAKVANFGGPRIGLVVSKSVGNAVTRHAISRKLRHVSLSVIDEIPDTYHIVIRALPRSATASSQELLKDVRSALAASRRS